MHIPLLLLHGALGSATMFDDLRRHLPVGQQILSPDFPGHGGLPANEPFSIPAFARAVIEYLDERQISQVNVFGYSMGGYVALYLAWKYPERVLRMATLGTKLDWTPETAARETARLDPDKIAAKVPAFAQLLSERHAPADWRDVVRKTRDLLHHLGNGQALGPEVFRAISCPVAIGLGEKDNMVAREESQEVAALLPQGSFHLLSDTPHPLEQVEPEVLAGWMLGIGD